MSTTQTGKPRSSKKVPRKTTPSVDVPKVSAAPETAQSDAEKREALVRIVAYSFYERRGFVCGHELDDWLQAEMEVDRQLATVQARRQAD